MKELAIVLYVFAVLLGLFGYWGSFTKAGEKAYDEMDGLIPFFAMVVSGILLIISVILSIVIYLRKDRK